MNRKYDIDNKFIIKEDEKVKIIRSENFNLNFVKSSGYTETWGRNIEDDPDFCPIGPVIADIEISEVCDEGCTFCYKSNNINGKNMSIDTFKQVFHKLPRTLTQIAFGIGSIDGNKDLKKIMDYCLENDYQKITPNITINGSHMTAEWYDYLSKTCGAIAVSYYGEHCFNAVKELTDRGMEQVNIHCILSEQTFDKCMDLIDKVQTDIRLEKLNAVVFLMLKPRGRGEKFLRLSDEKYSIFVKKLFESKINFGFDSCGAGRLLKEDIPEEVKKYITPCESTRESCYINVDGKFFPCSFTEDGEGIDITKVNDFIEDVWMNDKICQWRQKLLDNNCNCTIYEV